MEQIRKSLKKETSSFIAMSKAPDIVYHQSMACKRKSLIRGLSDACRVRSKSSIHCYSFILFSRVVYKK